MISKDTGDIIKVLSHFQKFRYEIEFSELK